jgi:hypothetical protein
MLKFVVIAMGVAAIEAGQASNVTVRSVSPQDVVEPRGIDLRDYVSQHLSPSARTLAGPLPKTRGPGAFSSPSISGPPVPGVFNSRPPSGPISPPRPPARTKQTPEVPVEDKPSDISEDEAEELWRELLDIKKKFIGPMEKPPEYSATWRPADAYHSALRDAANFPNDSPFYRYIWTRPEDCNHIDVAINSVITTLEVSERIHSRVSKSNGMIGSFGCYRLDGGNVIRVDLREGSKSFDDVLRKIEVWDKYRDFEPYFTTNSKLVFKGWRRLAKTEDKNNPWVSGEKEFALQGPHLLAGKFGLPTPLQLRTFTDVPIVQGDWWVRISSSAVSGGLYYDWRDIDQSEKIGAKEDDDESGLEVYLKRALADPELKFEKDGGQLKILDYFGSEKKWATTISRITGNPRAVVIVRQTLSSASEDSGLIMLTMDTSEDDFDVKNNPFHTLVNHKFAAVEVLLQLPNGQIEGSLWDQFGDRQDSAPDNVASDFTVPDGHPKRLTPMVSCWSCHSRERGWMELDRSNSFARLLANYDVYQIPGKGEDEDIIESRALIRNLYLGDFDQMLRRARDDLDESVVEITGLPAEDPVGSIWGGLGQMYTDYWYAGVDAAEALKYLGYDTQDAVALLGRLVVQLPTDQIRISPEDPSVAALLAGMSITRADFERIYVDLAVRSLEVERAQGRLRQR